MIFFSKREFFLVSKVGDDQRKKGEGEDLANVQTLNGTFLLLYPTNWQHFYLPARYFSLFLFPTYFFRSIRKASKRDTVLSESLSENAPNAGDGHVDLEAPIL